MMLPRLPSCPRAEQAPEQLGHLRTLQVFYFDHMEPVLRTDLRGPHPLGNLVGVRGRLREEQVESPRDEGTTRESVSTR